MDLLRITKSKTREKILQLFFADDNKKYYPRQLEKILDLPVSNIHRELTMMEKSGLFRKEKIANSVFYYLNKESAIFNDFKNIVFKTIGIEGTLRKELEKIKGIRRAFIFGSFAKGKEDSASDVDLMIIGNPDEDKLVVVISRLEGLFNREINYHIWGQKEFNAKAKTESFIQSILEKSKIELI
ncbi:MAG: nucleotidyltransferase domain-containing protein [Patescibacteria group bacterium]|nr:nucleotidyltransferase domain-containing protein [Patescibacteria group bacterium]